MMIIITMVISVRKNVFGVFGERIFRDRSPIFGDGGERRKYLKRRKTRTSINDTIVYLGGTEWTREACLYFREGKYIFIIYYNLFVRYLEIDMRALSVVQRSKTFSYL